MILKAPYDLVQHRRTSPACRIALYPSKEALAAKAQGVALVECGLGVDVRCNG